MRGLKLFAVCAAALFSLLVPAVGHAQTGQRPKASGRGVEQQIEALTQQMVQAQLHGDPTAYEQHYADNAVIIHAPGTLFTKSEEIGDLKSGAIKYDSYDVRDKKIDIYGDTAVVEMLASVKGTFKGKSFDSDFRVTRVWVRSKGNWKVVLFQTTRVAPPTP